MATVAEDTRERIQESRALVLLSPIGRGGQNHRLERLGELL
jgi:hypothetical protein